ncbi:MAG: YcaO-like family protein [Candidatus Nomurabacteria bacterium]|nr:YcaO-like family protein [Candidatus Nomurabacteria bacterium]
MKEYVEKIKILESDLVSDIQKYTFYTKTKYFSFVATVKMFLLAKLLKIDEGEIILYKTNKQIAFRSLLNSIISKGFIESFGEGPIYSDYPRLFIIGMDYFINKSKTDQKMRAWGCVFPFEDKEIAYAKSLGEAVERNATYFLESENMRKYPKIIHGDASFLYEYIPKFTKKQIEKDKRMVSSERDLTLVRGFFVNSITGDKKRFLPLPFIYWGETSRKDEKISFHNTSSGGGGGITYEQAFLSAIYETIERDHFLLYWFSGVNPNIISNDSIPGAFGDYVRKAIKDYNLEIYFLDTKYDLDVKSCVCVVIDPVLNIITMGGKAHSSSIETLKSSLIEAILVIVNTREREKMMSESELFDILKEKTFTKKLGRLDRVNLYCSQKGIAMVKKQFLNGVTISYKEFSDGEKEFSSKKEEKEFTVSLFKDLVIKKGKGYHIYHHKATSVWTEELDYEVCSVFVPALLKLHLEEILATPVSERLFLFAKEKGKPINNENDIVTLPHFFP